MQSSRIKYNVDINFFVSIIFFLIIFMQFFGLFRIAVIFNSTIYSLPMQYAMTFMSVGTFLYFKDKFKVSKLELFLIAYPVLMIPWGIYNNTLDRHIITDPISVFYFFSMIIVFKNSNIREEKIEKGMNLMFYALIIFLALTYVLQAMGVYLFSVAKTSIYFVAPAIYFFFKKKKLKLFLSLLTIVLATKRSLLIALPLSFTLYYFFIKRMSLKYRVGIILSTLLLIYGVLFVTGQADFYLRFPGHLATLFYKLSQINPLSENFDLQENYRIYEVIFSWNYSMENILNIFIGKGPGFHYDVFRENGTIWFEKVYNTHFTPMALMSKYGLVYCLALVIYLLEVFVKSLKLIISNDDNHMYKLFFCYSVCSLFEMLTSFSLFINLLGNLFIGRILYHYESKKKCSHII